MKGFYYIENSIDEYHSKSSVYTETLEEAKEAIKYCADWFLSMGTGRIYFQPVEFSVKSKRIRQPGAKFICRGKGLDSNGEVIFTKEEY